MTEDNIAVAMNYIYMRDQAKSLLRDIESGKEVSPQAITSMFPWADSVEFLSGLLKRRLDECTAELKKLGVD